MSDTKEREMRTADVAHGDISSTCFGCGRAIHLFFNGGELDGMRCCGYEYRLELVRIDFVVIAPDSATDSVTSVSLEEDNQ